MLFCAPATPTAVVATSYLLRVSPRERGSSTAAYCSEDFSRSLVSDHAGVFRFGNIGRNGVPACGFALVQAEIGALGRGVRYHSFHLRNAGEGQMHGRPWPEATNASPFHADRVLFDQYMEALDLILAAPEIRDSLREFNLSPASVRMAMVADASRVLGSARREFAVYQEVLSKESGGPAADPSQITRGSRRGVESLLRLWLAVTSALAALCVAIGIAWMQAWHWGSDWAPVPVWAGSVVLFTVAIAWLAWRYANTITGRDALRGIWESQSSPQVQAARLQLMTAVSGTELLAHVRALVNDVRQGRFGEEYSVTSSPGLSARYDSLNRISTLAEGELDRLIERLDGASIGVAGARGSGKSTLVRKYCEQAGSADDAHDEEEIDWWALLYGVLPERAASDLRCMVAAPVNYVAQDFVLHLFAAFCQVVIGSYRSAVNVRGLYLAAFWLHRVWDLLKSLLWRAVFYGIPAAAFLIWEHAAARAFSISPTWVRYGAITLIGLGVLSWIGSARRVIRRRPGKVRGGDSGSIVASAHTHLHHIRFLITVTAGWSAGLPLPRGASAQYTRAVARAEQPVSYPEVVDDFRNFARIVAADVHRKGGGVFIGVDELDKIGSPDQAEQFLNEIKGIFGIPHVYFIVSVSDDALTAFERRGLPLRDAFDSSFDEIIYVGPLSYPESRNLLYRRVIGLSEPYVALCHCLAGGLSRDVIRAARQIVRTAIKLQAASPTRAHADDFDPVTAMAYLASGGRMPERPRLTLSVISAAVIKDELHRKLRATTHVAGRVAPDQASELHDALHQVASHLNQGRPIIDMIDLLGKSAQGEPAPLASLRIDTAAYAYFCATLQDVFTGHLDKSRIIQATSESNGPGTFDALAAARNAFAIDTFLAWRLISQFRAEWSLGTRQAPNWT